MKICGIMEFGRGQLVEIADELLLQAEADKCADAIHAMGRGEVAYDEAEWYALIARFGRIMVALKSDPAAIEAVN